MFENLNWWEIGALLMLALLIFGERLPKVIGDGLRMLRGLRAMAQNATTDLNRELGTDLQLQDLRTGSPRWSPRTTSPTPRSPCCARRASTRAAPTT